MSAIILDEISMVKAWMLAYLDKRLKEAKQNYSNPFGGVAVLMLGDFDQQPPIGGSSLPHLAIKVLQQEYQHEHNIFYAKLSKQQTIKLHSTLCQRGVKLFETAGCLNLSTQYHCTNDPEHMENLKKMNTGIPLTSSDFELSQSDFKSINDFLFGTIIETRNYEHQEFNAFIANFWVHHFNTHIVWRKKKIHRFC